MNTLLDCSSLAYGDVSGPPAQCGMSNRDLSMGVSTQFILGPVHFIRSLLGFSTSEIVLGDLGPRADPARPGVRNLNP